MHADASKSRSRTKALAGVGDNLPPNGLLHILWLFPERRPTDDEADDWEGEHGEHSVALMLGLPKAQPVIPIMQDDPNRDPRP
jgi:hypothetical protein